MRRRSATPGAGRPSKGDRKAFMTRMPVTLGELVEQRADVDDLSYSEVIANAVAAYFGQQPVAVPRDEEQMQLTA